MAQLADMRSGIFNYTEDAAFVEELIEDLERPWSAPELVAVADRNLVYFPAGAGWHYSNTNTVMLGMVVEQVTGRPIAEEIRARTLEPVGLASTYYPAMPNMPHPYAHGYGFDPLEDVTRSKVSNRLNTSNGQSCDVERVASQRLVSPVRASRQFQ